MKFRHILSKGQKLKVRKFQVLSSSGKKVIKKNPTAPSPHPPPLSPMHNRVKKVANTVPWPYVIGDPNGEETAGTFQEKTCRKQIKKSQS